MLVKEYRIPLPMAVEEYRVAQLYMIQVGGGAGAGRTRTALSTCACDAMRPSQRSVSRWVSGWRARRRAQRHAVGVCGVAWAPSAELRARDAHHLAQPDGALVSSGLRLPQPNSADWRPRTDIYSSQVWRLGSRRPRRRQI